MEEAIQSSLSFSTCTSGIIAVVCQMISCTGHVLEDLAFSTTLCFIYSTSFSVSHICQGIYIIFQHNTSQLLFFVSFMCVFVSVSLFSIDIYWILLVLKRIHKRNNAAHADFIFFCVHLSLCLHLCIYHCINLTISVTAVAAFLEYCWGF